FLFTGMQSIAQTSSSKYTDEDYMKFKKETDAKIASNQKRITELRTKKANTSSDMKDEMYESRIAALEERNKNLEKKIDAYKSEKDHSQWEAFKKEMNHDFSELGTALKDFGKDNTKSTKK
ncbi:MAG: hypothetical protein ACXVPQ_11830, partial [Bacteroidia bacterium]